MADRKPVKVLPDGGGDSAGLAEFVAADTIGIVDGGTGLATVAASNILTGNGTSALSAESNLTFDGSTLAVTGSMTLSSTSTISGDMTFVDNAKVTLGTGGDADLSYNGADTILLTSVAGTGGLGIGTAPDLMVQDGVHIKTGDSGASANVHADELIIEGSANSGINILSGASSVGRFTFTDSGGDPGAIAYVHSTNDMVFNVNSLEAIRIQDSGFVGVNAADAVSPLQVEEAGTAGLNTVKVMKTNNSAVGNIIFTNTNTASGTGFAFLAAQADTDGSPTNEFNLRGDGTGLSDIAWSDNSLDYAEYFESTDGAALELGKSVVLENGKVRIYTDSDSANDIVGIVRPKAEAKGPSAHGMAWNHWQGKYLTDDFGVYLREDVTVWSWDEIKAVEASEGVEAVEGRKEGGVYERNELRKDENWTPPEGAVSSTQSVRKLNPEYSVEVDDETNYTSREKRDEWNLIGLLGQVPIKADEPTRPTWIKMKDISDAVELWMIR